MPPILEPIDSASHDLSKYRVSCHVNSVYYHQKLLEGCDNMYAAVVLELFFDQADADLSMWAIISKFMNLMCQ